MKARSQARTALESLSKIKNQPSPTYVRRANIANGPQQNNGVSENTTPATAPAPLRNAEPIRPNELKEIEHEQGLASQRRSKMAEAIGTWSPWLRSTGPRTPKGKARASRNAWRGGHRPLIRALGHKPFETKPRGHMTRASPLGWTRLPPHP
jgi:hypothetical protein